MKLIANRTCKSIYRLFAKNPSVFLKDSILPSIKSLKREPVLVIEKFLPNFFLKTKFRQGSSNAKKG